MAGCLRGDPLLVLGSCEMGSVGFEGLQQGCREHGERSAVRPLRSLGSGRLKPEFG